MEINEKLIHFTGIGGISMSALACFAIMNGAYVTGSDLNDIPNIDYLNRIGIKSYIGSNPLIAGSADIMVYTSAVGNNDPEVNHAAERGVQIMPRHEFLNLIASSYNNVIAVSGTHGKTTVTAMITAILQKAEYPFAAHIGGFSNDIKGNFYHKGSCLFVTEACEYKRSFLSLKPTLAIILNIDRDHPDTYPDSDQLWDAFNQFSAGAEITLAFSDFSDKPNIVTFGYDNKSNYYPINIRVDEEERYYFDICLDEHILVREVYLPIPGQHNILNAVCAAAAASMWGVSEEDIRRGLNEFKGVKRRFECKGRFNSALIISDYAHHPSEIRAVISTARKIAKNKLIAVFEPHTFSRTKALIEEFKDCFQGADRIIILPTYAARETEANGMNSNELANMINCDNVVSVISYYEARQAALQDAGNGDVILVIGAGSIEKLANMLAETNISN